MNKQQIVNRVYEVFIRDGNKASTKGINCYYGNPDEGPGCAVACLMNRKVREKLNDEECSNGSFSVSDGLDKGIIPKSFKPQENLLIDLQGWHDEASRKTKRLNTRFHINEFKNICAKHKIQYPGDM